MREVTAADPSNADAWSLQATVSLALERWDHAQEEAGQAVRLEPDNAAFHLRLGVILGQKERFADAARSLQHALRIEPDNAEIKSLLGWNLSRTGEVDRGVTLMEEAHEYDPDDGPNADRYAVGLCEQIVASWSTYPDDSKDITNERQLQYSQERLAKLDAMNRRPEGFEEEVDEVRRVVEESAKVKLQSWHNGLRCFLGMIIFFIVGVSMVNAGYESFTAPGVALTIAAFGWPAFFIWRRVMPGWKWARRHATPAVRRTGLQ